MDRLNRVYQLVCSYHNFFQRVMQLQRRTHNGAIAQPLKHLNPLGHAPSKQPHHQRPHSQLAAVVESIGSLPVGCIFPSTVPKVLHRNATGLPGDPVPKESQKYSAKPPSMVVTSHP